MTQGTKQRGAGIEHRKVALQVIMLTHSLLAMWQQGTELKLVCTCFITEKLKPDIQHVQTIDLEQEKLLLALAEGGKHAGQPQLSSG